MANRVTQDQLRIAAKLRAKGETWPEIARQTGASQRTLQYHAKKEGWTVGSAKPRKNGARDLARNDDRTIEQIAELVRDRLANDIEASANTLASWQAESLDLRDWQKREQIAESIQKRASSLLNVGKQEENVVNIAVLSQLPDSANGSVIDG